MKHLLGSLARCFLWFRGKDNRPVDGACIILPASRNDGVGVQALVRICAMSLAWQHRASYVHLPFCMIAHQGMDTEGREVSSAVWSMQWEAFFNLGEAQHTSRDLMRIMSEVPTVPQGERVRKGTGKAQYQTLLRWVEDVRCKKHGLYTFGLDLCQNFTACGLGFNRDFIRSLQARFNASGYVPRTEIYDDAFVNIAIHIRRGDVWEGVKQDPDNAMYAIRLQDEAYYVALLENLHRLFSSSVRPVCFHLFSDGAPDNFEQFTFLNDTEAELRLPTAQTIENIRIYFRHNTMDTLYHMINAPILFPGKSTFSIVAMLLNDGSIIFDDEVQRFPVHQVVDAYIEMNEKVVLLRNLDASEAIKMEQMPERSA